MPDQYNKLVGNTSKYPYLVGISTEAGDLGTGILISPRFVLTCSHVLHDSTSAEVVFSEGSTSARVQKIDDSLDLALLELERPISAPKAKFSDSPLQPGATVMVAGVQATPGQPDQLSIAEIELKFRNKNVADGKILDIQLDGGARPGYSGGPVVVDKGGGLLCIGVMRSGGAGANTSNAAGLASIGAFVAEYVVSGMPEAKSGNKAEGIRRRPILTAVLLGVCVIGAIAKWLYLTTHSPKVTSSPVIVATPEPQRTASGQPTPRKRPVSFPQAPGPRFNPKTKGSAPLIDSTPTVPVKSSSINQGNPDVKVWVNTASGVYHCPETRWYGKTKHGEYLTQAEAQKKANRPAYGKECP